MKGADIAMVKQLKPEVYIADDSFSMGFENPKSNVLQNVEHLSTSYRAENVHWCTRKASFGVHVRINTF